MWPRTTLHFWSFFLLLPSASCHTCFPWCWGLNPEAYACRPNSTNQTTPPTLPGFRATVFLTTIQVSSQTCFKEDTFECQLSSKTKAKTKLKQLIQDPTAWEQVQMQRWLYPFPRCIEQGASWRELRGTEDESEMAINKHEAQSLHSLSSFPVVNSCTALHCPQERVKDQSSISQTRKLTPHPGSFPQQQCLWVIPADFHPDLGAQRHPWNTVSVCE